MKHPYEHLASFFGAWFHQDFDLAGDTVEEIVAAFKASASREEVEWVDADIRRLLADMGGELESRFDELFDLDIDPKAFAPSVEAFLVQIRAALSKNAGENRQTSK